MKEINSNANGLAGFVVTAKDGSLIADINLQDRTIIEVNEYKITEYTNESQPVFRERKVMFPWN